MESAERRAANAVRIASRKVVVATLLSLVLFAVGCGVAAAVIVRGLIPSGPQQASLRVVLIGKGQSTLSGTFAGHALSGKSSAPDLAVTHKLCPAARPGDLGMGVTYKGSYRGTSYVIHACDASTTALDFRVSGKVGTAALSASSTYSFTTGKAPFQGHLGKQTVKGSATVKWTGKNDDELIITAKFTVS